MVEYRIEKSQAVCVKTGSPLEEGATYYAVLFEDGESFRREAFSEQAWYGPPEGAYCFFKTRVPTKQKKKRLLVDDDILMTFFRRLGGETELARLQFRFVLALILMRKRLLKYEETITEDEAEIWIMRIGKEDELHKVVNPRLNDHEIESVSKQLTAILHGDMGDFDDTLDSDDDRDPTEEDVA